jgi:protein-disulfide isomerase
VEGVVASALGPKDMVVVRKHLEDPALDDDVDRDALLGLRREVVSTPTMFISGGGTFEKVEGALTYGAMQRRLDALLP